jgi:hypothetical protein
MLKLRVTYTYAVHIELSNMHADSDGMITTVCLLPICTHNTGVPAYTHSSSSNNNITSTNNSSSTDLQELIASTFPDFQSKSG